MECKIEKYFWDAEEFIECLDGAGEALFEKKEKQAMPYSRKELFADDTTIYSVDSINKTRLFVFVGYFKKGITKSVMQMQQNHPSTIINENGYTGCESSR